jgi:hypothetical protein
MIKISTQFLILFHPFPFQLGFVIGASEGQDVTVFGTSPVLLGQGSTDLTTDEAMDLTIERLRLILKVLPISII